MNADERSHHQPQGFGPTTLRCLLLAGVCALLAACAPAERLRGKIAGLKDVAEQAERSGAVRCAPRELALAQSHLSFAETELAQGFVSKAEHHIAVAEPNAQAALFLSPAKYCAEKVAAADKDGDGILDPSDSCPTVPENYNGSADADGCPDDPDLDGDGLTESRDNCPLEPEDADAYLDVDGCPELDNDLDGVPDSVDRCPLEPEDPDGYEDIDGCPELDNDRDEVADLEDACPNEVGPGDREPRGCPKKTLAVVTDCEVRITEQIHFEYNRAEIRAQSRPVLDAVVDVLNRNPSIKLEVQGHTDDRGSAPYNLDLSQRRASAVVKYLLEHGVPSARLTARGYGLERPLVENSDDRTRALNRRVQFVRTEGERDGCQTPPQ